MMTSNKWVVQLLLDQCIAHGLVDWVFSPGSRNAPLAISADNHPDISTTVIHDERSAAFFAMGMAERLQKPVVLCCTSGSAPVNYLPAVTEAFYRNIPLLVVSADRPTAWVDQGDGQTIRQQDIFKNFTHSFVHLEDQPFREDLLWEYQRKSAIALQKVLHHGPVHFNVALAEPLYGTKEKTTNYSRIIHLHYNHHPAQQTIDEIQALIEGKKIMVLCGQMPENVRLLQALEVFADQSNVAVLTENTSNLYSKKFNACIDRSLNKLRDTHIEDYRPEILISLGGAVVSKRIKSFLRKSNLEAHIRIGLHFPEMDTYQHLTHSLVCLPELFIEALNGHKQSLSMHNFSGKWKQVDYENQDKMHDFKLEANVLTDFQVYQSFFEVVPEGTVIHMANSSVIRYCQLFDPIPSCVYFANRGTSGIDGSASTAQGFASKDQRMNVLLVGDVSFLYDLNALQLRHLVSNFKILLINNKGGGIFRIIDGAKDSPQRERYFEAAHDRHGAVCQAFGWQYRSVEKVIEIDEAVQELLFTDNITCLEVFTSPEHSPEALEKFFNFVQ
jgi:2-succinyl-5-enolpyruvyl-6-hydroxy-3-cyclohexene-1-carboxylate synthase